MTFDSLARALSTRSPIDIDGAPFTLSLTSLREPMPHETKAINVAFTAVNGATRHNGELHLGVDCCPVGAVLPRGPGAWPEVA